MIFERLIWAHSRSLLGRASTLISVLDFMAKNLSNWQAAIHTRMNMPDVSSRTKQPKACWWHFFLTIEEACRRGQQYFTHMPNQDFAEKKVNRLDRQNGKSLREAQVTKQFWASYTHILWIPPLFCSNLPLSLLFTLSFRFICLWKFIIFYVSELSFSITGNKCHLLLSVG